ncbi:MAG: signal peptide peptidase SppA [Persicimonas sp.]
MSQDNQPAPDGDSESSVDKRGLLVVALVFGGLFVALLVFSVVMITVFDGGGPGGKARIAVVEVEGPIMESQKIVEDLYEFRRDDDIEGIVVRVESPGGSVGPSQEIAQAIEQASEEKPVVASMGSTAASGGYYVSLGAERIFANAGTLTGSIGVISQMFNVEKLLERVDVDVHVLTAGDLKDAGSPFDEFDEREREFFLSLLQDIYDQFVEDIAEARDLDVDEVEDLADGRVYTGRQAEEKDLVDEVGSFRDAVEWVKEEADVEGKEKLVYPPDEDLGFLGELVEGASDAAKKEVRSNTTPVVEYRMAH